MKRSLCVLTGFFLGSIGQSLLGQGTQFLYQGQLNVNGSPTTGLFDMTFSLYTTNVGGVQVGSTLTNVAVPVTNGMFTSAVDFGPGIFTGPPRWLQLGVRTNGSTGGFTNLTAMQEVTPTPYAIMANSASNVLGVLPQSALAGSYTNAVSLTNPANVLGGNGSSISNVNASLLDGLAATNFWQTGGNTGTSPSKGNYLGTADNNPLQFGVNGLAALRLQPGTSPNVIGGLSSNYVASGVTGATIAGGGWGTASNVVTGNNGFVGGGAGNSATVLAAVGGGSNNAAGGSYAVVAGGLGNVASAPNSFIGSGQSNTIQSGATYGVIGGGLGNVVQASGVGASISGGNNNTNNGNYGTIAGGQNNSILGPGFYQPSIGGGYGNVASNWYAAIGGGIQNTNLGNSGVIAGGQANFVGNYSAASIGGGFNNQALNAYATVPGGYENIASGAYSFAAGQQAQALNQGTFVWADSQSGAFASTANNEFLIRAGGGVGINTNNPNGASFYTLGSRTGGFGFAVGYFENANTTGNSSPALRVVVDGGNPSDGALSVSANIPTTTAGLIAEFGNADAFVTMISNNGTIYAPGFVGNGSQLTAVASAITLGNNFLTTTQLDGVAANTNLYLTSHPLYLRGDNGVDHNHGLAYAGSTITNNFPNSAVLPDGPVLWGYTGGALGVLSNGATAVLTWNNGQVNISGSVSATSLTGNGTINWVNDLSASVQAVPNYGYFVNPSNSFTATITLPTAPKVADIVRVTCGNSSGWKIAQNSGQVIVGTFSNGTTTTLGTSGYLQGAEYSAVELQFVGNGTFIPLSQEGSLTVH